MLNPLSEGASHTTNSARQRPRICLESSVFSALFGRTEERWKICRSILQDAQEKRIECYVSALVLVECPVQALPSGTCVETSPMSSDTSSDASDAAAEDVVAEFFESEFITRCNVDPFVGELARRLRRELSATASSTASATAALAPGQWLWLATALLQECSYLMTYEPKLLKLAGQPALGYLQVVTPCRPWSSGQLTLQDFEGVMDGAALSTRAGNGLVLSDSALAPLSRRAVEM
jgi:predicted nucleic acid-binding protein